MNVHMSSGGQKIILSSIYAMWVVLNSSYQCWGK